MNRGPCGTGHESDGACGEAPIRLLSLPNSLSAPLAGRDGFYGILVKFSIAVGLLPTGGQAWAKFNFYYCKEIEEINGTQKKYIEKRDPFHYVPEKKRFYENMDKSNSHFPPYLRGNNEL